MTRLSAWKTFFAIFLLSAATAIIAPGQTFNTLLSFDRTDGSSPDLLSLVQGTDGNFYGTTYGGGANNFGTAFRITPGGMLTTLHSFDKIDGRGPSSGLVQTHNGDFYGTTIYGGVGNDGTVASNYGTVFKITQGGSLTTLYSFCAQTKCADGANPTGTLLQASDGNLYGTTSSYGNKLPGTVFKMTPGGELTTLHTFCSLPSCADGFFPVAGLLQATDGALYGTTFAGGANNYGTVFKITPAGTLTTLHSFDGTDGANPYAGTLLQATDGALYGTTFAGGGSNNDCNGGCGTVFKMTLAGTLTTLYSFCSQFECADGIWPYTGLAQGTDGNFYGTTYGGGGIFWPYGTVFKISPEGKLTTLRSFHGMDGAHPIGGLLQATNGEFYGTTPAGGGDEEGTVYSLSVGLGPFVKLERDSGKVGQTGGILGQGFTGTTSVSLNGTPASFTVVSDTFIRATVPPGATTGYVTVVTPSGTLTSNVPFRVLQ
jgi:uncharacterized repeat protein (TIGR03803 family)